jgi:hypothetical protein
MRPRFRRGRYCGTPGVARDFFVRFPCEFSSSPSSRRPKETAMNPNKPAQPSPVQPSRLPEPKKRFRLQKLEERIAPKGAPFTKKCRPSW